MDRLLGLLIKLFIFLSGFGTYEKWEPGKKLKLLMVGYNGARNTGADARVAAAVKQIKELFGADNVHMTVLTLSEKALEGYFDEDVEIREINSIFLKDLYKACFQVNTYIVCRSILLNDTSKKY